MAIAKTLPGVKITVWSDGQQLTEHKNIAGYHGGPIGKVVAKFIEATTDMEFLFKIRVSKSYQLDCPNLLFNFYVDGVSVGGVLCGEYELLHGSWTKKVEGVKQPTEKRNIVGLRKFRFSELVAERYRSGKAREDRQSTLQLGKLQVQVHRCSSFYTLPRGSVDVKSDLPTISEKVLKKRKISHGTTYSPTKRLLENATLYDVTYVDGEDNPLAVFSFSYRSKDPLQKELDKQVKEAEFKQETIERKRKRKEKVDEDNAYLSDGNELFVAASDLARKARGFEGRAEIETINLIDDLEDD